MMMMMMQSVFETLVNFSHLTGLSAHKDSIVCCIREGFQT